MRKYQKHNCWIYAVYKGDKLICDGTREEICEYLGIKKNTFQFYRTKIYKEKRCKTPKCKTIIRIDGNDKIYNLQQE